MNPKYHILRSDYHIEPFVSGGLGEQKYMATHIADPSQRLFVKGSSHVDACREFVSLQLAARMGIKVPRAWLFFPQEAMNMVGIEWIEEEPAPSWDEIRKDEKLLFQIVSAQIVHVLFGDDDTMDYAFHDGDIFTYDFGETFALSDVYYIMMNQFENIADQNMKNKISDLLKTTIGAYSPNTLFAYEMVVNELQLCSAEYFSTVLKDCCNRFINIGMDEIEEILSALTPVYPAMMKDYLRAYLKQVDSFCRDVLSQ